MTIKYMGTDKEGQEMADRLIRAMSRGMTVTSDMRPSNKHQWPKCAKCGQRKPMVYADNGLCPGCDDIEGGKADIAEVVT
jgi:hypothetical protein